MTVDDVAMNANIANIEHFSNADVLFPELTEPVRAIFSFPDQVTRLKNGSKLSLPEFTLVTLEHETVSFLPDMNLNISLDDGRQFRMEIVDCPGDGKGRRISRLREQKIDAATPDLQY